VSPPDEAGDAPSTRAGPPTGGPPTPSWPGPTELGAAMVLSSPLAMIALDRDRTVRSFNAAAERLTARDAEEVVGGHARQLFASEHAATALESIEAAGAGEGAHLELRLLHGGGGEVLAGMSWGPLVIGGRRGGLVGVGRDITRRKRLEHELTAMASSLRALGATSDLGMYRISFRPEPCVEYLNPVLEAWLGASTRQMREDPGLLRERLGTQAVGRLAAARRGQTPAAGPVETTWTQPDGSTLHVQIRESALPDLDGRVTSVIGIVTDVTSQRRQEEALAEALRLERQAAEELRRVDDLRRLFLQAVSHELRTPLTSVLGFASTLQDRYAEVPPAQAIEMAGRIREQGRRIERLLDDLLDIEQLSRGVVGLDRRLLDLGGLVRTVVEEHGDARMALSTPASPAWVDRAKVERIVANLLSNARRHGGPDAAVRVSVEPAEPSVRIVVEDDGPGVADGLKRRIFEPFEQGPQASTAASPGTGIGLALVAAFADLHGGGAWVEDSHLGGARFVVELPPG
jgi:PAS domain S-box-containing protein